MAAIVKSKGTTASERLLAALGDRSFLSLWAYPNVFRDRGKELCDLLVVCGRHVIVFSDKSVGWPDKADLELSWGRWYRRAIGHSASQLARAISWIRSHPDRLFLDAACTQPFPIELFSPEEMEIHGVVVARGAARACFNHFKAGSGSLGLAPTQSRTQKKGEVPPVPFFVGNPSPTDEVYHILDDISLRILLLELDTITDFTSYLNARAKLFKNEQLLGAHGEEDLLAVYLKDVNETGDHDFVTSCGESLKPNAQIVIEGGSYDLFRKRSEYKRKKAAHHVSYVWDRLIETFAKNIIDDTTYLVRGYEDLHEPTKRELGLRYMALAGRLERRSNGQAITQAFDKIGRHDRFFRAMFAGPTVEDRSTGFFILLVKRDSFLRDKSDEDYRRFRTNLAYGYALNLLRHTPYLKRVVGIATEGEVRRRTRSEDLLYAEQLEWTPDQIAEAERVAKGMEIFKSGPPTEKNAQYRRPLEYPPSHYAQSGGEAVPYAYVPESVTRGNRKERRAAKAKRRKGSFR